MGLKKKYTFYLCKECEIDFLVRLKRHGRVFCPSCGEGLMVEMVRTLWVEQPLQHHRWWSEDEDGLLISGVEQGYSHQEIADALEGRKVEGVRNRLKRLRAKGVL